LRSDRYRYFTALCRESMRHAGMLRIDHVMGILRQFWVPDGKTARDGAYVAFPFEDLAGIVALESVRARTVVIGEDLGVVPSGLRERMAELGMLRSQVLYFERGDGGAFHPPVWYARDALATVNTHDLPPLAGYWSERDIDVRKLAGELSDDAADERARNERRATKQALLELLKQEGCIEADENPEAVADDLVVAVHRLLARTSAVIVGAAFDDLCMEIDALNIPGLDFAAQPSWTRRANKTSEVLEKDPLGLRVLAALRSVRRA
jgi:4-alpha-glucanotransferase